MLGPSSWAGSWAGHGSLGLPAEGMAQLEMGCDTPGEHCSKAVQGHRGQAAADGTSHQREPGSHGCDRCVLREPHSHVAHVCPEEPGSHRWDVCPHMY